MQQGTIKNFHEQVPKQVWTGTIVPVELPPVGFTITRRGLGVEVVLTTTQGLRLPCSSFETAMRLVEKAAQYRPPY